MLILATILCFTLNKYVQIGYKKLQSKYKWLQVEIDNTNHASELEQSNLEV